MFLPTNSPHASRRLADIDIELTKVLYGVYAAENDDYGKLAGNLENYSVPLIDMFMFVYDLKDDGYVTLDGELGRRA